MGVYIELIQQKFKSPEDKKYNNMHTKKKGANHFLNKILAYEEIQSKNH